MAFQILLNLLIAFTWMFFQNEWTFLTYFTGYLIGMLIIFAMRRYFSTRFYMKNIWAVFKLMLLFLKELLLSNIAVFKVIINPKLNINPVIFALPIELEKDWEITTLANLITLTPGTLVLEVSDDNKTLYIHAMNVSDVKEAIKDIKETFEEAIKEVSR